MSRADGSVLPNPSIPKTLGIMSTIFASLMILFGLCLGGSTVILPRIIDLMSQTQKNLAKTVEVNKQAQIKSIEEKEKAATTDAEKASLKSEKDAVQAQQMPAQPDLKPLAEYASTPTYLAYALTYFGTGLLLAIMLLVVGIGLIRLKPWGGTSGTWWAGLQIVQVVVMLGANLIYVLPAQKPVQDKMVGKMEADAKAKGINNPALPSMKMAQSMQGSMAVAQAVVMAIIGCIYPTVMLILLNTAGAKAALIPVRKPGLEGF